LNARFALRDRTGKAHERVDAAFGRFDLTDRHSYADFLTGHASALLPLEEALTSAGAAGLTEDWASHRRAPLLLADHGALDVAPPPLVPAPDFADEAEMLGGLYVLEGSRLGGAVLRKAVPPHLPAAFLSAPQAPRRWTRFASELDLLLDTPSRLDAAVHAALACFACFERAADVASVA
jgi:heme oxygenase